MFSIGTFPVRTRLENKRERKRYNKIKDNTIKTRHKKQGYCNNTKTYKKYISKYKTAIIVKDKCSLCKRHESNCCNTSYPVSFATLDSATIQSNCIFSHIQSIPEKILQQLQLFPYSFKERVHHIHSYTIAFDNLSPRSSTFETDFCKKYPEYKSSWKKEITTLRRWSRKEIYCHVAFKKFLSIWLYKKYHSRQINTEDPVTLEIPKNPILLFQPSQRGSWVFDAQSLRKSMEASLGYTEYMMPEPRVPKNSLTNIPFEPYQIDNLLYKLRSYQQSSWLLEGYKSERYNLKRFATMFHSALKVRGLEQLCKDETSEEYIFELVEFIQSELEYHQTLYRTTLMRTIEWAVRNKSNDTYIKKWKSLFKEFMTSYFLERESRSSSRPASFTIARVHEQSYRLITNRFNLEQYEILRLNALGSQVVPNTHQEHYVEDASAESDSEHTVHDNDRHSINPPTPPLPSNVITALLTNIVLLDLDAL